MAVRSPISPWAAPQQAPLPSEQLSPSDPSWAIQPTVIGVVVRQEESKVRDRSPPALRGAPAHLASGQRTGNPGNWLCPAGLQSPHYGHPWPGPSLEVARTLSPFPASRLRPTGSGRLCVMPSAGPGPGHLGGVRSLRAGWVDAFKLWYWRRLLRVPWTTRRSNQSILKEINPEYSLEGLMLKLKLQYFGHLMRRTDSFEKTLMLGKTEGRRRRQQRMKWLDGITDSMDMNLSKF